MFPKKVILPLFAIAMASFVACGDDDSSFNPTSDKTTPANEKQPDGQLPDTLQNFSDTEKYPCSQTENKCATVYVVGHSHPVQCDGMGGWFEAFTGSVEGCGDTQSNPDIVGPSDISPVNPDIQPTNPDVQPTNPDVQPTNPDVQPVKPAGDKIACSSGPMCTEGPAEFASECEEEDGETLLDACPAGGEPCDIGEADITVYLYDGAGLTCADLLAFMQM